MDTYLNKCPYLYFVIKYSFHFRRSGNNSLMEVFLTKAFIKNYNLKNIKIKFLILYLLNITDIIFTFLLLSTGFYREVNIFMINVVESIHASFILKVILPAVLLMFIYFRMRNATDYQLKKSNVFINGSITIYALINISHIIWFALLPILSSYSC